MPERMTLQGLDQNSRQEPAQPFTISAGPLPQLKLWLGIILLAALLPHAPAQIRDGNIDPYNLGKGDWIYYINMATNRMSGNVPWVTNEASLMQFYKSQGVQWLAVKAATSDELFDGGYDFAQFNSNLVAAAHAEGLKIFGYNRSYGSNILGEVEMADHVFNEGGDGFIFDAEAEWESSRSWIGNNGPALANQLCSLVRSNWPNKFLAHAPLPIIGYHNSFPYKEFGYWCDAVMPQDYWTSIGVSPEAMLLWRNSEWHAWENSLSGIWTNAIKPLAPIGQGWSPSASEILPPEEITRYFDALRNDAYAPGKGGGYSGVSFWRADLHTMGMWGAIRTNEYVDLTTNPPEITRQPSHAEVTAGDPIAFSIDVIGSAPMVYQWVLNGTNIPEAISRTYEKAHAQPADAGDYSIVVTNKFGQAVSSNATLIVNVPPTIVTPPESQWVTAGQDVAFEVVAEGTDPLLYQWRLNETDLPGATNSVYTISGVTLDAAGEYTVLVSNIAGTVITEPANLTVTPAPVAPFITVQPLDARVPAGRTAEFHVVAQGTTPLFYTWSFNGTNIPGATESTLVILNARPENAGPYSVIVSNIAGTTVSSNAVLSVGRQIETAELWNLPGGSRPYLTTASQYERGMAYNRVTDRLLVATRASGTPEIYVLDGKTGEDQHMLQTYNLSGGTYSMNMVGAGDDGAIYAANLAASGSGFKVYRWVDDSPDSIAEIVFSGNPDPAVTQRWGDTLDVRGAGTNTQILIGSRNGREFAVLTTTDEQTFTSHPFTVSDARDGAFGLGIAFGPGNTIYGNAAGMPLIHATFDLATGEAFLLASFGSECLPSSVSPIGFDPDRQLLAGICFASPDTLNLYDLATSDGTPQLLTADAFGSDNPNSYNTGAVDFGEDTVYALDSNNGLLALALVSDSPPLIIAQPQSQLAMEGSRVALSVVAKGTSPISYEWHFHGTNVPGAVTREFIIESVSTNHAGPYHVVLSNAFGMATSEVATLAVQAAISLTEALDDPQLLWSTDLGSGWFGQADVTLDGIDAAQSGLITHSQSSTLRTSVVGPGTLTFWWKVSSEAGYDFLSFMTDGTGVTSISGETAWTSVDYDVAEGLHELSWVYSKDSSVSDGLDAGWLDLVEWVAACTNCAPEITEQPQSIRAVDGKPAEITVVATGTSPLFYQWRFNGIPQPGQTNASISLPVATAADSGAYSVLVSNAFGSVPSTEATLEIVPVVAQVIDDFEPGIDMSQWFGFGGQPGSTVIATNIGGSVSGANSLWFGGDGQRCVTAAPVIAGPSTVIAYFLRFGSDMSGNWERVDIPSEGVVLEFSTDGGETWSTLASHTTTEFYDWTLVSLSVPEQAQGNGTLFRWRQLTHSGACCDQWAVDDIRIVPGPVPPEIVREPSDVSVYEGRTVRFQVGAWGSTPLACQWYSTTGPIGGATGPILTLTNVQMSDAGVYYASVSNAYGTVFSSNATLSVMPTPPCMPPPPDIVGWWKGDQSLADSAGLNELAAWGPLIGVGFEEGMVNSAFKLNGGCLRASASSALDVGPGPGLTIEGWIQPSGFNSSSMIASWNTDVDYPSRVGTGLFLSPTFGPGFDTRGLSLLGVFTATNNVSTQVYCASMTVTTGAWHHVALTYDRGSGVAALYLNGAAVAQTNMGSVALMTSTPFLIGGQPNYGLFFNGLIDEVSVYARGLLPEEIQAIYNSQQGGKCAVSQVCVPPATDAVAWWRGQSNLDDTISLNDAFWSGGQSWGYYTNGRVGLGFAFNGAYLRVPASPEIDLGAEDGLTVEGWMKLSSTFTSPAPLVDWNNGMGNIGLGIMANGYNGLEATLTPSNMQALVVRTPNNVVNRGAWQHFALTYEKAGGLALLYLNGEEVARTNVGNIRPATTSNLYLGYRPSGNYGGSRIIGGALDEITLYRKALSPAEIYAIARAGEAGKCASERTCTPPASGIVGWWQAESNAWNRISGQPAQADNMTYVSGKAGSAFSIGTSGAYVQVPAAPWQDVGTGPGLTLEMWLKPNTPVGPIAEWNDGQGHIGTRLWLNEPYAGTPGLGSLKATLVETNGAPHLLESPTWAVTNTIWQHVALTYDKGSGIATLYVNGNPVAIDNVGTFTPQTSYDLLFGRRLSGPYVGTLYGAMDEISLYNRALTPDEIRAVVAARDLGKCDDQPVIVVEPQSLKVNEGNTAQFEPQVSGTPPMTYCWTRDSEPLPDQYSPWLTLTNVQFDQGGLYILRVTNLFGTALSTGATLVVNRAPTVTGLQVVTLEDVATNITLTASDPDQDPLTLAIVSGPLHGTISGTIPNIVYQPDADYWGPDQIEFQASDGLAVSQSAFVLIEVTPENDRPIAHDQSLTTPEDTAVGVTLTASDPDADALTFTVTAPLHGTLSGQPPNLIYTPTTNFHGDDAFAFEVRDGKLVSLPGQVSITVLPVNDAPTAHIVVSPVAEFPNITNLVVIATNNTDAALTLDGTTSFDVDNDPLSYSWFLGTNWLSNEPIASTVLPLGAHEVTLVVSDGQLSGTNAATIDVISPAEAVGLLIMLIEDSNLPGNLQQSFSASLQAALSSFDRGSVVSGLNQLEALKNKISAQLSRSNPELAALLTRAIDEVINTWNPAAPGQK